MKKLLIFLVISIIIGFSVYTQKIPKEKSLDTAIVLSTGKGELYILVTPEQVHFEPFEHVTSPYKGFSLSKTQYPKLFEQGLANMSFITAEVVEDNENETLIKVSNNQPDHGGYLPTYELMVNPLNGEVTDE